MAMAVVFAMLASYAISRTLVPTLVMYLMRHREQALGRSALGVRYDDDRDTLFAGAARAAAAVQQARRVGRKVGVDDKAQVRQVEAAGGDVCGHTGAGMAVAQGLQGVGPFLLRQFPRELHGREPALAQGAVEVTHPFTRGAEDQRAGAFEVAQQVYDRVFDLVRGYADGA
eukprot:gene48305-65529_t